jgi:hypothetical protein
MKFYNKPYVRYGDKRVRQFFAWIPFRHENITYWLQTVEVCEEYIVNFYYPFVKGWKIRVVLDPDPICNDVNKSFRQLYR